MDYPSLEEALDEIGITARVEARLEKQVEARIEKQVEARAKVQVAKKLIQKGWDSTEIAEMTDLDLPTVESLMGTAHD